MHFKLNKELAGLATKDNLTKLPNRLFLVDYAQVILQNTVYVSRILLFYI
jgi:GGDEF domain-containing protein